MNTSMSGLVDDQPIREKGTMLKNIWRHTQIKEPTQWLDSKLATTIREPKHYVGSILNENCFKQSTEYLS